MARRFSLAATALLAISYVNAFVVNRSNSAAFSTSSALEMVSIAPPEKIAGSDKLGLLDTNKTTRAEKGTGIKVPEGQKLRIGIVGAGLAGMVTGMDLSEVS